MTIHDDTAKTPHETSAEALSGRGIREQYGEAARLGAASCGQPRRSGVSAVAGEAVMNNMG
jgi:hypothetical protein